MDILFRLETVAETTVDNHPYQTIMFEYSEAAKEIRMLREKVRDWQPVSSMPRDKTPILVYLEAPVQCSRIHSAYFTATFGTIGPYFEIDAPKVLYWMHQPDAPWNGFKKNGE